MSSPRSEIRCERAGLISAYALGAVAADEAILVEAHLATCSECRNTLDELRPVVDSLAFWPADVLRPSEALRYRLALRIAAETGGEPMLASHCQWTEPAWEQVAPGLSCKLLAMDWEHDRVSMLVRLAAGAAYPPHRHAGREELYLLNGDLWIDDKKLCAGGYNVGERGTVDERVWSETGCTCILMTSTRDVIGRV